MTIMVVAGSPDPRQHPFGSGQRPLSGRLCGAQLAEEPASRRRFPVAFRRPAFASRIILRPPRVRPSSRSAHQTRSRLDLDGVVTFRTRQIRPGRVPSVPRGRWCAPARPGSPGRHPPPHSDRPLPPAETSHRARVLMTRRQRGFTQFTRPAFPSLWPPDGTAALGPLPRAPHPTVTRDARRGGDSPLRTGPDATSPASAEPPLDEHHCTRATSCRTTRFSHDPEVGVKWTWILGLAASQVRISIRLWAA